MSEDEGFTLEFTAKQAAVTFLFVGLVLGGASGLAVGAYTFDTSQSESPAPTDSGQQKNAESGSGGSIKLEGINLENEPSKGEDSAPIKVIEYTDYGCPFCTEWAGFDASARIPIDSLDVSGELESQYVETGEVEFILKDYPVPGLHPNGPKAHKAANCVYQESK
ncbi:MAG: thioredoxin domain-containing protein, partial [Candidatus Nanohalobium sp.]